MQNAGSADPAKVVFQMNGMSVIFTADLNDLRARLADAADAALDQARAQYTADWQRAEDALVAAGVEMFEHGDRLTIEGGISRLAERSRADGLVVATLMDMIGARNRDDLVRVVGQMMRAAQNAPKG